MAFAVSSLDANDAVVCVLGRRDRLETSRSLRTPVGTEPLCMPLWAERSSARGTCERAYTSCSSGKG